MKNRVFMCRCEDVTSHEVDDAIARGMTTVEEIKRYTGLGTGPCQGKECLCALVGLLVDRGHADAATVTPFTARPPSEAVTFGALAALPEDGQGQGGGAS